MFKRRTTFIVGAGASQEVGLPVGSELAKIISKKLDIRFDDFGTRHIGDGDIYLFEHFRRAFPREANQYQKAGWLIRDGLHLTKSIDDFLDIHSKDVRVNRIGKAAIAKAILEAEKASRLFVDNSTIDQRLNMEKLGDTWFVKLIRMLGPGIQPEKIDAIFSNVSFIVFNYDRCIEYFLLHALQYLYAISEPEAAALLQKLRIIHPYGAVGPLRSSATPSGVPFGSASQNYLSLADRIKTYTEQIEAAGELERLRSEIATSVPGISGLWIPRTKYALDKAKQKIEEKESFGTAYAMSHSDADIVRDEIDNFFKP